MRTSSRSRLFVVLLGAGLAGALAAFPFLLRIAGTLAKPGSASVPPWPVLLVAYLGQNAVLIGLAVWAGLALDRARGRTCLPYLGAWLSGEPASRSAGAVLGSAAAFGLGLGAVLAVADGLLFLPRLPESRALYDAIPLGLRLLGGFFYGGITEELLTRFFLLSLVAWTFARVARSPSGEPSPVLFWAGNVATALLFAAGHLPLAAAFGPLNAAALTRVLLLNGLAGVAFGYVFWSRGLEAAVVAHASAHLALQPLTPWLASI